MSSIRQLSYIGGGTNIPDSVFVSAGGLGATGKWVTIPTTALVGLSEATIASLVAMHNSLLLNFRDIGFMTVAPLP